MLRRLRKFVLIAGTLLSLLIVAAFVVSGSWWAWCTLPGGHLVAVHSGTFEYAGALPQNWSLGYSQHGRGFGFEPIITPKGGGFGFVIPLVYPFLCVAIPTLLVWRFWPKPVKPGHCRCGYDLQGNESGRCPECGVEVQA